jgi:hypothetical protein
MRRTIGLFLASLALLIQVMVPVAAAGMTRVADPLANAAICSHDGSTLPSQPDGTLPSHDCGICLACAFIHAPPLGRTASAGAAYPAARIIVWHLAGDDVVLARFAHDGQARGPPSLI